MIVFSGCSSNVSDSGKMIYNGYHSDDAKSLDPAVAYDTISWDIVPSIYETLYEYSYLSDPFEATPLLAADMPTYSNDRLTLTIPLRRDVCFQKDVAFSNSKDTKCPGSRSMTADDFIYSFKRLARPEVSSPGLWIFEGKIAGVTEFKDKLTKAKKEDRPELFKLPIDGFKALDDYTLQITLTEPYPQLLYILTLSFTAPVPHEAIEKYGDEKGSINETPVGTGPFKLKKWLRGNRIDLVRNENYRPVFYPSNGADRFKKMGLLEDSGKKLPFLDEVRIQIIKEEQPAWLIFTKGKIDAMGLPRDNFNQAITDKINLSKEFFDKGVDLTIDAGTTFYFLLFNMKDPIVGKNKYLRQAISRAIDREEFIKLFTNNTGLKMTHALPPGVSGRPDSSNIKYDFNIEEAKKLLAKAGYPNGKGLPKLTFDTRNASSMSRQLGEYMKKQVLKIGIKDFDVIMNPFPGYLQKAREGNLQIAHGGWVIDYPDAENVYQLVYGPNSAPGPNTANYNNPELNAVYDKMRIMEASPARIKLIEKMETIIQEDMPWAYLNYRTSYRLTQRWLRNFRGSQMIPSEYKYYKIDKKLKEKFIKTR